MTDTIAQTSNSRPPRRWPKLVAIIAGSIFVLLILLYFVATSAAFFKGVILPKAGAAMNATITVSDASISPFKEITLQNLKVQTTGTEPLVAVSEVRLHYSLMDIIGGNIHVDEILINNPTLVLVENPDGSSNLDPILKSQNNKPASQPTSAPSKSEKPLKIDLKKIAIKDATIRRVKLYAGGHRDVQEISHVNLTLDDLKNGQTGKLGLSAELSVDSNPPTGAAGAIAAKLNGAFTIALSPDLKPSSIQGNTRLDVTRATGALAQAGALGINFDVDLTPTDLKQLALRLQRGDTRLTEVLLRGPLDLEKKEGKLTFQISGIDKKLFNWAGAGVGLDFGPSTFGTTNEIQLTKNGSAVSVVGALSLNQFQVTRTNQTTPPLDLQIQYNVAVDVAGNNAVVSLLSLAGTQKGAPFLQGGLTSPMTVAWGNTKDAVGDSALKVSVTHLDLGDWKPFLGQVVPAGEVNATLQLLSQQAGKLLTFDMSSQVANLTINAGSNQVTQASVGLAASGKVEQKASTGKAATTMQCDLKNFEFKFARQDQPLVIASGNGSYDTATESADFQVGAQLMLARLMQLFPMPQAQVTDGTAETKIHLTQKEKTQNVTGSFNLSKFTGQFGNISLRSLGVSADLDVTMTPSQAQINKLAGNLTQNGKAGGNFELSGTYGLSNQVAKLNARLADFNQDGLGPFLQAGLGDKKLVSVALNANAAIQYDPQSASAIKADLLVTNLVVNDPKGQLPSTPLETKFQVDIGLNKQVADLRQITLAFTPVATNQIQLTGKIDMTQTNAIQGNLKIAGDTLDLTTMYDLFGGQSKPASAATTTSPSPITTPTSPAPSGDQQAPAVVLPLRNFTADANLKHLRLHELDVSDILVTTKIDGGHVVVNPCKLAINAAPVDSTVDLDLGVPGYKYDVAFSAKAIPLAPLVNSFQPARKGQVGGTFSAQAKVRGEGTTGASLKKNLTGDFDMGSTNLNLSVANIKSPMLKALVNVVTMIPDLIKNSGNVNSLLSGLVGAATTKGGLSDELSRSPLDSIVARGSMGTGVVTLQNALVQSPAFRAEVNGGSVTLDSILTNSVLQIPISLALSQGVAQQIKLASSGTATNSGYVKLPDFLTMKGTVGTPKTDINKMALAAMALKSYGGSAGQSGGVLQGVSGLLGGQSGNKTASTNTTGNAVGNLLQEVLGGSAPSGKTNAAPSANTNRAPLNNLLKGLLNPKN